MKRPAPKRPLAALLVALLLALPVTALASPPTTGGHGITALGPGLAK